MRLLRSDLLRIHCRSPLNEVSFIDLRRLGVESLNPGPTGIDEQTKIHIHVNPDQEPSQQQQQQPPPPPQPTKEKKSLTAPVRTWEYTGNPLGQCTVLQVLLLSENRLTSLAGLECCQGTLWKLDVRSNQIHDLTAFLSMEHLGEVDLGQNNVSYDELVKLSHVHIMSLRLDGNPLLVGGGGSGPEDTVYRRNVLHLLPNVWSLDGAIVTARERRAAARYFAGFAGKDEVPEPVRAVLALAKRVGAPRTTTHGGGGGGTISDGNSGGNSDGNSDGTGDGGSSGGNNSVFAWGSSQFMLAPFATDVSSTTTQHPTTQHPTASTTATTTASTTQHTTASTTRYPNDIAASVHEWASPSPLPPSTVACHVFQHLLLRQPFLPESQGIPRLLP